MDYQVLHPGQVCIIDKYNDANIAGDTLLFVKIVKELPRLLTRRSYEVQFCTDKGEPLSDTTFPVYREKLFPYFDQEFVIRLPTNTPMVSRPELMAFKSLLFVAEKDGLITDDQMRLYLKDLSAKLEYFVEVQREY